MEEKMNYKFEQKYFNLYLNIQEDVLEEIKYKQNHFERKFFSDETNRVFCKTLIENGLNRDDCEDILKLNNLHPNFPVYMLRGGCRMCFFKSEKEYRAMYHLNRKEFDEMVDFEEGMQDKRLKYYAIMGNGKSLRQLGIECQQEKLMFNEIETLYKSLKKETSCGAFCHR